MTVEGPEDGGDEEPWEGRGANEPNIDARGEEVGEWGECGEGAFRVWRGLGVCEGEETRLRLGRGVFERNKDEVLTTLAFGWLC